jgi:hypothetical protein
VLFANITLFKSPFHATEAPELLFYHIEQCQEIMTLGKLPHTMEQVILNALCLLMALQIFPLREFDTWENTTIKTYPASEVQSKMIFMGHQISSCHVPVVRSFFIL